ncbi:MAG: hypothetical protein J0H74_35805 [Chitinophagaceae bacterium]|nr:hypothetical protein [Chitinophagaceae bacterium]
MLIRLTIILLLFSVSTHAQDVNYWSSSYGPGGFLAPGATIANNGDSGVFFFNPALFGYSRKSSASISGTIYQYQYTRIKDGAGTGLDLKSTGGSVVPQIVSNTITLKIKKPFTIAYALVHEPVMSFTGTQRKDARQNVLSDTYSPGAEIFVGQYTAQNSIDETAGILSTGFMLSPRLALGFSAEGRIRKQSYSLDLTSRALFNISTDTIFPPIASTKEYYLNTYTHIGVRFKTGLAYDIGARDHLGLLLTFPLLRISGFSTVVADNEINNIRLDSSFTWNLLATTRQTDLKAKYKMPISLALGYTHDFGTEQLFFTAEYFAKVKEYNIVTPRKEAFIRPDTANNAGTPLLTRLKDARMAILNIAIGFSKVLTPTTTGFISARTDFNYGGPSNYKADERGLGYTSNTSDWDLYHMQLGANFKKRKFNLRVGLLLDYGRTTQYPQEVNYDNPNESNFLLGESHLTKASRLGAGLMFAYIHNL